MKPELFNHPLSNALTNFFFDDIDCCTIDYIYDNILRSTTYNFLNSYKIKNLPHPLNASTNSFLQLTSLQDYNRAMNRARPNLGILRACIIIPFEANRCGWSKRRSASSSTTTTTTMTTTFSFPSPRDVVSVSRGRGRPVYDS